MPGLKSLLRGLAAKPFGPSLFLGSDEMGNHRDTSVEAIGRRRVKGHGESGEEPRGVGPRTRGPDPGQEGL
jgi:hypothetical protein